MADTAYLASLKATAAHLEQSIAARESRKEGQHDDYNLVTEREKLRLTEVQAEIKKITPPPPVTEASALESAKPSEAAPAEPPIATAP